MYQYVLIKNGKLKICKSISLSKVIKKELGFFDYQDCLFEEDESIYLLVKDLSFYDDNTSIIYRDFCDELSYFNGTVIFTKMDENGFVSLSNNDIKIVKNHLCQLSDGIFDMRYFIN